MLERLKKMKEEGVFELSVPVPKKSTAEIMQEAHRVRCVGGGRSPGGDDARSAGGRIMQSQVHEEGHRGRGWGIERMSSSNRSPSRSDSPSKSSRQPSKTHPAQSTVKRREVDTNPRGSRGVYHMSKEVRSPEQAKKPLKALGVRERQDPPVSAPELFRRNTDGLTTRFDGTLPDRGSNSAHSNSISTPSQTTEKEKKLLSKTSMRSSGTTNEGKDSERDKDRDRDKDRHKNECSHQGGDDFIFSPDLSIFKSSRARLALNKSVRGNCMKGKPSSAFGTTCWTPQAPVSNVCSPVMR